MRIRVGDLEDDDISKVNDDVSKVILKDVFSRRHNMNELLT